MDVSIDGTIYQFTSGSYNTAIGYHSASFIKEVGEPDILCCPDPVTTYMEVIPYPMLDRLERFPKLPNSTEALLLCFGVLLSLVLIVSIRGRQKVEE